MRLQAPDPPHPPLLLPKRPVRNEKMPIINRPFDWSSFV